MRNRNSFSMKTLRASSRSKCSVTEPASEFSIGMTAAATAPRCTRSKTSTERAQATISQPGTIRRAASWLNEPASPWIAILIPLVIIPLAIGCLSLGQLSWLRRRKQIFLQYERVHAIRIVPRQCFDYGVVMSFVERNGSLVVHRGFKNHGLTVGGTQPVLGHPKQLRSDADSASVGQNIDSDDVAGAAAPRFRNNESHGHDS